MYGFGRKPEYLCQSSVLEYHLFGADKEIKKEGIRRVNRTAGRMNEGKKKKNIAVADWGARKRFGAEDLVAARFRWRQQNPPLHVRAMVLADTTLFVVGPPDVVDEVAALRTFDQGATQKRLARQIAAFGGAEGALLWAVSTDGAKLSEQKLESVPVFDGMASAGGRLYMATTDGKVPCLGGR